MNKNNIRVELVQKVLASTPNEAFVIIIWTIVTVTYFENDRLIVLLQVIGKDVCVHQRLPTLA